MISTHTLISAIADADVVVDAGLHSIGDDSVAADNVYRDAYLTLVSQLHDAIRKATR